MAEKRELLESLLESFDNSLSVEQRVEWHIKNNFTKCQNLVRETADERIGAILGVSGDYLDGRVTKVSSIMDSIAIDFAFVDSKSVDIDDAKKRGVSDALIQKYDESVRADKTAIAKGAFDKISILYGADVQFAGAIIKDIQESLSNSKGELSLLSEIKSKLGANSTVEVVG